eukprot:TRINITY_DN25630_c0_g1_i1.p1 TRINITY_DN25630_c0_g1~~TRINITY_DN25630_c0_g1_i1.p1  ORF type:complete len:241 (-),score=21.65 TRINITY_DN25630_c0_g1_i1:388-1110(-)
MSTSEKKVAIVCTSAHEMQFKDGSGKMPTGLWLEEAATPYYIFKNAGMSVTFVSIKGGAVPIDAGSMGGDFFTAEAKKFMHDSEAFGSLCHSMSIADFEKESANSHDVLYLAGGHGTCADFVDNAPLKNLIESFYAKGKVVAADCHGPVALAQCFQADGTTPLVKGLEVTAFTNDEEGPGGVGLHEKVPFCPEDKLKELGAEFKKGAPWTSCVSVAGKLVTGQNPQSSEACAKKVLELVA